MFDKVKKYFKKYSLNDYLTKDTNGITMLERLLKHGISLSYDEETKILNSVEAGYLYIKYNKSIHRFKYTEEQLFTLVENVYFFEYLCNTKNTSSSMIEKIKDHVEVVDILIKYDKNKLLFINKEIVNKLLYKDINDNYLIEKYIKDDNVMNLLTEKIDDGKILLEISKKYKKIDWLKKSNELALMIKIKNNETLLDYLLNRNIIPNKLKNIPNNKEYIKLLIDKDLGEYLTNLDEKNMLNKLDSNKTILELLLEKNNLNKLNFTVYSESTISLLNRFNKLDLIENISIRLLIEQSKKIIGKKGNNKTLLEYLLDNGYKPKFSESIFTEEKDKNLILKTLYEREEFELIASFLDNDGLFYSFENGQLLIDKLLERNINISIRGNIELKKLLNNYEENKSYLEFLLEKIKDKKIKYNLMNTSFVDCDINDIAQFYIALAKKDMIKYIKNLKEEDLLKEYKGKTLLDILIDLDKEITIDKILSDDIKSNLKISIILKSKGINIEQISIPLLDNNYVYDYLINMQNTYGIGPFQERGEYLLNKLKEKFLSDSSSDHNLINALLIGYRRSLINNYSVTIKELENLIKIKDNNIRFRYFHVNEGNCFRKILGSVLCDSLSINTILHETGHALHYYIANNNYPKEFVEVIETTQKNNNILKRVKYISDKYNEQKNNIKKIVELNFERYFNNYYIKEKLNEINDYLSNTKEEKKEEFKELGIEEEKLNIMLEEIYSIDNYIKNCKRIIIEEQTNIMMYEENGCIMAISDIIDGLFEGNFYSGNLFDDENKIINISSGHGIPYYSCHNNMIFNEMIANFSVILKSNNFNEYLELLKAIIGEELYDLICNYYFEYIIGIEKTKTYKKRK